MKRYRVYIFLLLLAVFSIDYSAKAQFNTDSVFNAYITIESNKELNAFMAFVENTDDVLGMATKMRTGRFSKLVDTAIFYCKKTDNKKAERRLLLYRFLVPTKFSKMEQMRVLREISKYEDVKESKHYLKLLQNLRFIYRDLELFDQFLKIIEEIKKHNDGSYNNDDIEYIRLLDRSFMFYHTKNYKKAIVAYSELGEILNKVSVEECSRLNNMGLCYQKMNMADSALWYFKASLKRYRDFMDGKPTPIDSSFFYVIKANIADVDVKNGNFKGAEATFKRQLAYSDMYGSPHLVLSSYLSLAKLEYGKSTFDIALVYIDSIENLYESPGLISYYLDALRLKSNIFFEQGKRKSGLEVEDLAEYLQDSTRAAKAAINYQAAAILLEMDEAIAAKNSATKKLTDTEEKSRLLISGLITALAVIGLIVWLLIAFRKKNKELSQQKKELNNTVSEREILLREIHHRVKNNLTIVSSLVQLKSRKIVDPTAKEIFKEAKHYILSMSKVHQLLYENEELKDIDMNYYFVSLVNELSHGYSGFNVTNNISINSIYLNIDQALILGILTSELVTNSFKYAFAEKEGQIWLEMIEENGYYCFTYKDSGPGFSTEQKARNKSFGLKLVKMSAEQLRGDLVLVTKDQFSVSISFKIK